MSGRLIALDKQPIICPFRVRETWRRLFAKIVLKVTRPEALVVYQDYQMCARLKAVIGIAVHGVQDILDEESTT